MEETTAIIKSILATHTSEPVFFQRNVVKEYLQVLVLHYLYAHPRYAGLVFYGGSCLSQCYGLPRLSEDLDFVDVEGSVSLEACAKDLEAFFREKTDLRASVQVQKFRIYLKFPILKELGLQKSESESNLLFLKVEVFKEFDFCTTYVIETKPLFRFNKSVLVKTFDLPTLMATKIRAVLYRKWEKTDKSGHTRIAVKGRDYFDLMWYLEKGIKPNLACIEPELTIERLKENLRMQVEKIDTRSIVLDLEHFISDRNFVENLGGSIKGVLKSQIGNM